MQRYSFLGLMAFTLILASCGGDDDTQPATEGGMPEGGMALSCTDSADCDDGNPCNGDETCVLNVCGGGAVASDGTVCMIGDDAAICLDGFCMNSICGDGYIDTTLTPAEECDDGNMDSLDGCESDCQFTCEVDGDCEDGNLCNGVETCNPTSNNCRTGTDLADGSPCGMDLACRSAECVSVGCGDGVVDTGEQCDDGNMTADDGCENDCRFSCTDDADCDDASVCTGTETCEVATHTCQPGTALDCSPTDACHRLADPACDAADGCQEDLIDGDMDGFAPMDLSCTDPMLGGDCNDMRDDIYPMAAELCDGDDNDCDSRIDEGNPVWFPDCDKDGYAPSGSAGTISCAAPSGRPSGCSLPAVGIQWTTRSPTGSANSDCNDDRDDVNPAITAYSTSPHSGTSYDWNCNGRDDKRYGTAGVSTESVCISSIRGCTGAAGWTGRSAPGCGTTSNYTGCSGGAFTRCHRLTAPRTQSCR